MIGRLKREWKELAVTHPTGLWLATVSSLFVTVAFIILLVIEIVLVVKNW